MRQIVIEGKRLAKWLRTAFEDDCGVVFLPCGAFDNELKAMLCLGYDVAPVIQHDGHIYAPASWLAQEYPRHAEAIHTIVARIAQTKPGDCEAGNVDARASQPSGAGQTGASRKANVEKK